MESKMINDLYTEQYKQADLVIETGDDTYLCYRQRTPYAAKPEEDACWKIALVRTINDGTTKITRILYPYGNDGYEFAPAKIDKYTFNYAK